ncbi:hypothetical protein KM043_007269 [Ampulex compressa]|nr:hypothetical protein KM043_007269 [Ampulex compressa]
MRARRDPEMKLQSRKRKEYWLGIIVYLNGMTGDQSKIDTRQWESIGRYDACLDNGKTGEIARAAQRELIGGPRHFRIPNTLIRKARRSMNHNFRSNGSNANYGSYSSVLKIQEPSKEHRTVSKARDPGLGRSSRI